MERNAALLKKKYNSLLVSTLAMTASLYLSGILDGIMVGRILSPLAFSAINLTLSVSFLENIFVALFTYGGNTLAVMYKGKRENEKANAITQKQYATSLGRSMVLLQNLNGSLWNPKEGEDFNEGFALKNPCISAIGL